MTFTYDTTTDIGKVRMLIPDRDEGNAIFQDSEIQAYLDLNDSSVKRATAEALETIASDQALTLKVISTLDLSTNGASVSDALMRRAEKLRAVAEDEDAGNGALFDYGEMVVNEFTKRERVQKQYKREG